MSTIETKQPIRSRELAYTNGGPPRTYTNALFEFASHHACDSITAISEEQGMHTHPVKLTQKCSERQAVNVFRGADSNSQTSLARERLREN